MSYDDPLAPWADADPDAMRRALEIEDFRGQLFALLDLAPKASSSDLAALPWTDRHERREFKSIRDQWASERAAKREEYRQTQERPIEDVTWDQIKAAVRTGDFKGAESAIKTLQLLQVAERTRPEQVSEDDFSRLSDMQAMVLAALVRQLRDEPLTEFDMRALAYVDTLTTAADQ